MVIRKIINYQSKSVGSKKESFLVALCASFKLHADCTKQILNIYCFSSKHPLVELPVYWNCLVQDNEGH